MPPPDAETVELRSQLEGLVGKLKAKQEEVSSSFKVFTLSTTNHTTFSTTNNIWGFPFNSTNKL